MRTASFLLRCFFVAQFLLTPSAPSPHFLFNCAFVVHLLCMECREVSSKPSCIRRLVVCIAVPSTHVIVSFMPFLLVKPSVIYKPFVQLSGPCTRASSVDECSISAYNKSHLYNSVINRKVGVVECGVCINNPHTTFEVHYAAMISFRA